MHQLTRERSNVSAHVQLGVHCIGDVFMQCGNADRRDVLRESMRRVGGSHERWRGRLLEFSWEWVDMPADVQLGIHGVGDIFVQCWNADRGDLFRESMRRVCGSHERWRWRLHQIPRERVDVSAHVQCRVYGIGDVFV